MEKDIALRVEDVDGEPWAGKYPNRYAAVSEIGSGIQC